MMMKDEESGYSVRRRRWKGRRDISNNEILLISVKQNLIFFSKK
jgi:hypothetical protein